MSFGASPTALGNIGMLIGIGELCLAPVYGWILDRFGSYLAIMLAGGCCTFGCLVRGIAFDLNWIYAGSLLIGLGAANLWTVVLTHVAKHSPTERREHVIAAFSFQVLVLKIAGKALYYPVERYLRGIGIDSQFTRYRIMMVTCPLFCVFGWVALALCGSEVRKAHKEEEAASELRQVSASKSGEHKSGYWPAAYWFVAAAMGIGAFAKASATVIWPLFINDVYSWGSSEYAGLLLTENLFTAGMVFICPTLSVSMGNANLVTLLCVMLALTGTFAFNEPPPAVHSATAFAFFAAQGMLDQTLKALGTLVVEASAQGKAFALLSMLCSLGDAAGSGIAARLYEQAPVLAPWLPPFLKGRAVPLALASLLLVLAALVLGTARKLFTNAANRQPRRISPPDSPLPIGEAQETATLLQRRRLVSD
eukprot:CAMPEP_0119304980 /NCGR_PEP_ID=MMETSP1333-20130426/6083_1 /TAXON_ID=418940 /ORGANISM="Scyphosphaera apsteinii, Strain RCC1455" /LENGTH=421 /DNA_ID=CAMNT_0007307971 /DNA_START=168 /DNA_END=1433 /DNA_ORIENTATION=-